MGWLANSELWYLNITPKGTIMAKPPSIHSLVESLCDTLCKGNDNLDIVRTQLSHSSLSTGIILPYVLDIKAT